MESSLSKRNMTAAGCKAAVGSDPNEVVTYTKTHEDAEVDGELLSTIATAVVSQHEKHTFGTSLLLYIKSKLPITPPVPPLRVIVRPYRPEEFHLSLNEKPEELLNRRRPYFRHRQSTNTLEVLCIPGTDWIKHYASLIATYYRLNISGDPMDARFTQYVLPRNFQCFNWLLNSNLRELDQVDTIALGYVKRFRRASSQSWESGSHTGDLTQRLFAWQIHHATDAASGSQNRSIALLDCRFNFWGDIAGSLVQVLHHFRKVRQVLYIGKAGSLREGDEPNAVIATGNKSWVGGAQICWDNAFQQIIDGDHSPEIQIGSNVSVYSPLEETYEWLSTWGERCRWVDCEVGHLASACVESGISFGYLNIISDNVAKSHEHDLTNEEEEIVRVKRQQLLSVIESTLDQHLDLPPAGLPNGNTALDLTKPFDTIPPGQLNPSDRSL